ncbi:hypothetical protein [Nocardioides sp. OK12]|uniref:hypothetical protein n=1 Tax=Nocardioides sp. OK12 TaxID=2758661 RepID=UPI0021C43166|nr:hypothetical protein [Nocardioides sp. OK12]
MTTRASRWGAAPPDGGPVAGPTPRTAIGLVLTAVLLGAGLLGGCSTDTLAEKGMEKAMEAGSGGDAVVDVDSDAGTVTIEGEDGSLSVGGGELPESFPEDVPLPDQAYQVVSAMELGGDEEMIMAALLVPGGDVAGTVEHLEAGFEEAGYEQTGNLRQDLDGNHYVQLQFTDGSTTVSLNVAGSDDEELSVSYTIGSADEL